MSDTNIALIFLGVIVVLSMFVFDDPGDPPSGSPPAAP